MASVINSVTPAGISVPQSVAGTVGRASNTVSSFVDRSFPGTVDRGVSSLVDRSVSPVSSRVSSTVDRSVSPVSSTVDRSVSPVSSRGLLDRSGGIDSAGSLRSVPSARSSGFTPASSIGSPERSSGRSLITPESPSATPRSISNDSRVKTSSPRSGAPASPTRANGVPIVATVTRSPRNSQVLAVSSNSPVVSPRVAKQVDDAGTAIVAVSGESGVSTAPLTSSSSSLSRVINTVMHDYSNKQKSQELEDQLDLAGMDQLTAKSSRPTFSRSVPTVGNDIDVIVEQEYYTPESVPVTETIYPLNSYLTSFNLSRATVSKDSELAEDDILSDPSDRLLQHHHYIPMRYLHLSNNREYVYALSPDGLPVFIDISNYESPSNLVAQANYSPANLALSDYSMQVANSVAEKTGYPYVAIDSAGFFSYREPDGGWFSFARDGVEKFPGAVETPLSQPVVEMGEIVANGETALYNIRQHYNEQSKDFKIKLAVNKGNTNTAIAAMNSAVNSYQAMIEHSYNAISNQLMLKRNWIENLNAGTFTNCDGTIFSKKIVECMDRLADIVKMSDILHSQQAPLIRQIEESYAELERLLQWRYPRN